MCVLCVCVCGRYVLVIRTCARTRLARQHLSLFSSPRFLDFQCSRTQRALPAGGSRGFSMPRQGTPQPCFVTLLQGMIRLTFCRVLGRTA